MNERIKLLIEQATTRIDPSAHDGVCWDFDKEKFAELIVRECMNICRECIKDGYDEAEEPRGRIKEHFGVEE